eukprot:378543-Rhodomonas_salina.1
MSGMEIAYGARKCYAMSGTEIAYRAIGPHAIKLRDARAMRCPGAPWHSCTVHSPYAMVERYGAIHLRDVRYFRVWY